MYGHVTTVSGLVPAVPPPATQTGDAELDGTRTTLYRERTWRQPCPRDLRVVPKLDCVASRWVDQRISPRREHADPALDRCVVSVALQSVRLRLASGTQAVFEGTMPAGMVHVSAPGHPVEAEFLTPCDFVHLHVANDDLRERLAAACARQAHQARGPHSVLMHDPLAAQLARTLTEEPTAGDPFYVEGIGRTIVMRVLASRPGASRASALPKWRLRRVQEYVVQNIAEPMTLADVARAAGLSRMHFAAQFRAATGCRPHDYLLNQRIECAKQALASTDRPLVDVALGVGFQTQSHFSTVFKKLTGETPGRWQRANRDLSRGEGAWHAPNGIHA